jgi:hypothetical protein
MFPHPRRPRTLQGGLEVCPRQPPGPCAAAHRTATHSRSSSVRGAGSAPPARTPARAQHVPEHSKTLATAEHCRDRRRKCETAPLGRLWPRQSWSVDVGTTSLRRRAALDISSLPWSPLQRADCTPTERPVGWSAAGGSAGESQVEQVQRAKSAKPRRLRPEAIESLSAMTGGRSCSRRLGHGHPGTSALTARNGASQWG